MISRRTFGLGLAAAAVAPAVPALAEAAPPPVQDLEYVVHFAHDAQNVDLRAVFETLFGDVEPKRVTFVVQPGVTLRATTVGEWTEGTHVAIVNNGALMGEPLNQETQLTAVKI